MGHKTVTPPPPSMALHAVKLAILCQTCFICKYLYHRVCVVISIICISSALKFCFVLGPEVCSTAPISYSQEYYWMLLSHQLFQCCCCYYCCCCCCCCSNRCCPRRRHHHRCWLLICCLGAFSHLHSGCIMNCTCSHSSCFSAVPCPPPKERSTGPGHQM